MAKHMQVEPKRCTSDLSFSFEEENEKMGENIVFPTEKFENLFDTE